MHVYPSIIIFIDDQFLQVIILNKIIRTEVVFYLHQNFRILFREIKSIDLITKPLLSLLIHENKFAYEIVWLDILNVKVKNVFTSLGVKTDKLVLKNGNLLHPLSNKICRSI